MKGDERESGGMKKEERVSKRVEGRGKGGIQTAKATHVFFSQKLHHICVSFDVNFNESLTNDIFSFEQLRPGILGYNETV